MVAQNNRAKNRQKAKRVKGGSLKMKLNETQKDIVRLVIEGKSNKQIAEELNYSIENVKKNLRICFKYFNVKNRVELVRESLLLLHYDFNN